MLFLFFFPPDRDSSPDEVKNKKQQRSVQHFQGLWQQSLVFIDSACRIPQQLVIRKHIAAVSASISMSHLS